MFPFLAGDGENGVSGLLPDFVAVEHHLRLNARMQQINRGVLLDQLTGKILSHREKIVADISGVYKSIVIHRFIRHGVLVQRRVEQKSVLLGEMLDQLGGVGRGRLRRCVCLLYGFQHIHRLRLDLFRYDTVTEANQPLLQPSVAHGVPQGGEGAEQPAVHQTQRFRVIEGIVKPGAGVRLDVEIICAVDLKK